jgi:hypothetical protein
VADREEWIEHLAGAILDGVSIDWAAVESNAEFAGHPVVCQKMHLELRPTFPHR